MKYVRGFFGFALAVAAGVTILWFGGSPVYSWVKVQAGIYVPTQAIVQSKGIETSTERSQDASGAGTSIMTYCPYLDYGYTVNGTTYVGRHITAADDCVTDRKMAAKLIEGFTVTTRVPVYYDRGNPAASLPRARLTFDRLFSSAVYWLLALVLISLGLVFFLYDIWG